MARGLMLADIDVVLLRKNYEEAVEKKEEYFMSQGHEFLVSYAKYLLEYLEKEK